MTLKLVLDKGHFITGINGTYFNAYDDLQVSGTIIEEGTLRHAMFSGSSISFDQDNNVRLDMISPYITGSINGSWEWPYKWSAKSINHFYTSDSSIMLFDNEYGATIPEHDFTTIVVDKGYVTEKTIGLTAIPNEGFIILTKLQDTIDMFNIGDQLEYKVEYIDRTSNEVISDFNSIMTSLSAGPTLVKDGEIVVDPVAEGFSEEKITTTSATRSVIGVTEDNLMAMFTLSSATVSEAAEIAINLGLINAINMDGGASSGLYYDGSYMNTPGRLISNALVVRELHEKPINITLNGQPLYFDSLPYLNQTYNRTLVPLRKIAESLNATVSWDGTTQSILITRYDVELRLQSDSTTVYVNGEPKEMDLPVLIRNDRSYVPVRFITEYFGGEVDWDQATNTVILNTVTLDSLFQTAKDYHANANYEKAIEYYTLAYEQDSSRLEFLKAIAEIYRVNLKDNETAITYYKQILDSTPDDYTVLKGYAAALSLVRDFDTAIDVNLHYIELRPDDYNGYYGLGAIYEVWDYRDLEKAEYYYNQALATNIPDWARSYIESLDFMN